MEAIFWGRNITLILGGFSFLAGIIYIFALGLTVKLNEVLSREVPTDRLSNLLERKVTMDTLENLLNKRVEVDKYLNKNFSTKDLEKSLARKIYVDEWTIKNHYLIGLIFIVIALVLLLLAI